MSRKETAEWIKFFADSGIPRSEAAKYALIFAENRIKPAMLLDLDKEYLLDMGIKAIGDIIAILKHAKLIAGQMSTEPLLQMSTTLKQPPPSVVQSRKTPIQKITYDSKDSSSNRKSQSALNSNMQNRPAVSVKRPSDLIVRPKHDIVHPKRARSSVFKRLANEDAVTSTTDDHKVTITMHGRNNRLSAAPSQVVAAHADVFSKGDRHDPGPLLDRSLVAMNSNSMGARITQLSKPRAHVDSPVKKRNPIRVVSHVEHLSEIDRKDLRALRFGHSNNEVRLPSRTYDREVFNTEKQSRFNFERPDSTTEGHIARRLGLSPKTSSDMSSSAGIFAARNSANAVRFTPEHGNYLNSERRSNHHEDDLLTPQSYYKDDLSRRHSYYGHDSGRSETKSALTLEQPVRNIVRKVTKINRRTGEIISEERKFVDRTVFSRLSK